jgi:hypothetical protein
MHDRRGNRSGLSRANRDARRTSTLAARTGALPYGKKDAPIFRQPPTEFRVNGAFLALLPLTLRCQRFRIPRFTFLARFKRPRALRHAALFIRSPARLVRAVHLDVAVQYPDVVAAHQGFP